MSCHQLHQFPMHALNELHQFTMLSVSWHQFPMLNALSEAGTSSPCLSVSWHQFPSELAPVPHALSELAHALSELAHALSELAHALSELVPVPHALSELAPVPHACISSTCMVSYRARDTLGCPSIPPHHHQKLTLLHIIRLCGGF